MRLLELICFFIRGFRASVFTCGASFGLQLFRAGLLCGGMFCSVVTFMGLNLLWMPGNMPFKVYLFGGLRMFM